MLIFPNINSIRSRQKKDEILKSLFRAFPYTLGAGILAVLLFRALELRLPGITNNFGPAQIQHMFAVIHPTHLKWMLEIVSTMQNPFLDYFLRKYFWIVMFGHNEITFRISSIIYSLGTVSICFISPFYFLKKEKLPNFYILFVCFITALFAVNNSTEIMSSVVARQHSFASFTSAIWVSIFLFYEGKNKHYLFAFVSLLAFNVHFFAMPIILGGYTYIIMRNLIIKEYKEMMISMVFFIIVFIISIGINYQSFLHLLSSPAQGAASNSFEHSINLGLNRYDRFMYDYMFLFFPPLVFFLANLSFIRRQENQKLILLSIVLIPLFLIYTAKGSNYGFGMRHYTPFFGIGMGLLTLFFYNTYNVVEQLKLFIHNNKRLSLIRNTTAGSLLIIMLIGVNGHNLLGNLLRDSAHIKIPPKNFSEYYRIYQELKQPQVPLFIINTFDWEDFTPYLYMRWMGTSGFNRGYDYGFEVVNSNNKGMHIAITTEEAMKKLKRFIEMNPKGKIILDDRKTIFNDLTVFDHPVVAEKVKRITCCDKNVWILSDIISVDEVYQIAKILKIPGKMFN